MEQYNKNYEELGITILNRKPDFDRLEAGFHFRLNNCTVPALKKLGLALNDLFMYLHLVTKVNGYEDGVNDNITMNRKWKIKMYKNDH